jgi:monomeric sarcosine oxidase
MMANTYDVIVLGAGAMGSAAAYQLARIGQRVLLLEQFELDHQKGSSHGASRIIRYAYDHPAYTELMKPTYPLWAALEAEAGETFYQRTGGLDFGHAGTATLSDVKNTLQRTGIPHEILDATEGNARWPQFRFEPGMEIIYQADAGIVAASKTVRALIRLAQQHGANTLFDTPVLRVIPHAKSVEVHTTAGVFTAARLIIAAGSWAGVVLANLGLRLPLYPLKTQEAYFESTNPAQFEPDTFPTFIAHLKDEYGFMPYGMASNFNSGVKVGLHGGKQVRLPSEIDYETDSHLLSQVKRFTDRHMPDVLGLRYARVCLYTMTPDEHFIIDRHPQYPQIVFGAGCSGHAFKFTPLLGKILADLAVQGSTEYDIQLFAANRFLSA